MHPCKLHITCDDFAAGEHPSYYQGQLIRGTVHVQVTRRMSATLRIEQIVEFPRSLEQQPGHEVLHRAVLATGVWEPGYYRFPFTCTTDHGPPSSDYARWTINTSVVNVQTDIWGMLDRFFQPIPASWFYFTKFEPGCAMLPPRGTDNALARIFVNRSNAIPQVGMAKALEKVGLTVAGVVFGPIVAVVAIGLIADSAPGSAMNLLAVWLAIVLVLCVPTLLMIWYFKPDRRRMKRPSSSVAPLVLPQPTTPMAPDRQDNQQATDGRTDATGQ